MQKLRNFIIKKAAPRMLASININNRLRLNIYYDNKTSGQFYLLKFRLFKRLEKCLSKLTKIYATYSTVTFYFKEITVYLYYLT